MHLFQVVSTAKLTATSSHYIQSEKELCIFLVLCTCVEEKKPHLFIPPGNIATKRSSLKLVE